MNPIVLAAGIIALLAWSKKSKGQPEVAQSNEPAPSPANPAGLDKPTGPSTTSEPTPSPANPAGLDKPTGPSTTSEPTPSPANPAGLEKDVEPQTDDSDTKADYKIVNDGNWSPSPANPKGLEEELMLDSATPTPSPANPKGLTDVIKSTTFEWAPDYPILPKAESESFYKVLTSMEVDANEFTAWLLKKTGYTKQDAGKGKLGAAPYRRRILLLGKQKGLLNEATIKEFIREKAEIERQRALEDERAKERAAKGYPAVLSGRVHVGNGVYADPTKESDCPMGFKFLNQRGYTGCVSDERYAEVMSEMAKNYPLLPPKQLSQAILLRYAGSLTDKAALTMPTDKLIDMIRQRAVGCTNKWCKVINDSFITDSTAFVLDRFEYRGVVFGKMDENWIAFYPIPVKVAGKKRKKNLPYVMFPLSEQEFKTYKDLAKYYKATK